MFSISAVVIFRTAGSNKAEIHAFVGNSFDNCVKKMHEKINEYNQRGTPVINHTIIDVGYKE